MNRWLSGLLVAACFLLPWSVPAPLVYRPGEGWSYEPVGGGKWERARAKDQLEVAQDAFDKKQYSLALKAARRTVKRWPLSDYAPKAQYLVGRCYEERNRNEKAFEEYQKVLTRYPKIENYAEILNRQFIIANKFLAGKRFRLWGVLPLFRSMERTSTMYSKVIRNGPYSEVAPQAQLNIGAAREKQKEFPLAVKAYETAADRYHDNKEIAAAALYKAAMAYNRQARRAEYDQGAAGQAIATFTDFIALYPDDPRGVEARKLIDSLRLEQARGSYEIARFYEKKRRWQGALVYYNDVQNHAPDSKYAETAKRRIEALKNRVPAIPQPKAEAPKVEAPKPATP